MADNTNVQRDDEIDLIELIVNLWREKFVIILSIVVITSLGSIYAFYKEKKTPLYVASVQLLIPSHSDLNSFNQTDDFRIEPEEAFALFLDTVESHDHNLATNALIKKELDTQTKIPSTNSRDIIYPQIDKKKDDALTPKIYTVRYKDENKQNLILLAKVDLKLATETVSKSIDNRYRSHLNSKISHIEKIQRSKLKTLENRLASRKAYILSARENETNKLQQALKVARALKLENPTTISKLAGDTSTVVNIKNIISSPNTIKNNLSSELTSIVDSTDTAKNKSNIIQENDEKEPLSLYISHLERRDYLRGEKILSAEIENLKSLGKNIFLDDEIVVLEGQKGLLGTNLELEKLRILENENSTKATLNFYSESISASPEKFKTLLIIAISVLLGGMMGFFIAIVRIMVRKYKQ